LIGLEFIAKTFKTEYKTIAQRLGVTPVTIQHWLKGRKRIPETRQQQLSELFSLPKEYFGKELEPAEKIQVQLVHLQQLAQAEGFDVEHTMLDDSGTEVAVRRHVNPYEGEMFHLFREQYREMLITQIRGLVGSDDDMQSDENYFLLKEVTCLLSDEDNRRTKTRLLEAVIYFLEYRGGEWGNPPQLEWCNEKDSFFEQLDELLKRHKIV
jgi:transcriptional regulator with XRE-family HTH domain